MEYVKLGDIIIKFDKSKIKAGEGKTKGKYPLYTCSPTVNKYLDSYLFDDEAIIIGTGGNAVINYNIGKFSVSTDCFTIKSNEKMYTKYLYYYLLANIKKISALYRGAGLRHLNKKEFLELDIKLISKETQKKLIYKLDKLVRIINLKRKQLKIINDLVKSQFVENISFNKLEVAV